MNNGKSSSAICPVCGCKLHMWRSTNGITYYSCQPCQLIWLPEEVAHEA